MKISTRKGNYFVNLPTLLYSDLKKCCENQDNIDIDLAAFLLHLIIKGTFKNKDNEQNGWVRLCYENLVKYNNKQYKHPEHFDFLEYHGFIETTTHINGIDGKKNTCIGYRIKDQYLNNDDLSSLLTLDGSTGYQKHKITNDKIKRSQHKYIQRRRVEAKHNTEHLTKWLDSTDFTINKDEAIKFIEHKYSAKKDVIKKAKRLHDIDKFDTALTAYSRDGKDDRLHHYFVQCGSDLKQFVRFRGQPLKEIDIKSSQPFIYTYILEVVIEIVTKYDDIKECTKQLTTVLNRLINNTGRGYYIDNRYHKVGIKNMIYYTIKTIKTLTPLDFVEIYNFIKLVRDGGIYEYVSEQLFALGSIKYVNDKYITKLIEEVSKGCYIQKEFEFDTLRDCAKKITLNALYSSPNNDKVAAVNHFLSLFPAVAKILAALKKSNYKDLPILMQRIEAKCILDHCSKKVAKKYPKLPLICRHDSLSTTVDWSDILEQEFTELLNNYFGMEVKVGISDW